LAASDFLVVGAPPVAGDDFRGTGEDTALTITRASLLANDADASGDTLTISGIATQPTHGTLTGGGGSDYVYTPDANFFGTDSFTYTVSDGKGGTDTGTVSVTVRSVNDVPTGSATGSTLLTTAEDTALDINQSEFLTGFSDVDTNDVLVVSSISADHGTVVDNGNGTFTFTPDANYNGPNVFTYTVSDGNGGTVAGTRSLTVSAVNDAPGLMS
jgi:hypothetical protein